MRFYTYQKEGQDYLAAAIHHKRYDLKELGFSFLDMNDLIKNLTPKIQKDIQHKIESGNYFSLPHSIPLKAPIPHPLQDILCLGINYEAHAEESARYKKEAFKRHRDYPVYFSKRCNEAIGDLGIIQSHQELVEDLDYECELAVILKKDCYKVKKEEVADYIFGYTIFNDVSARSIQTRHKQWYFGKSLDTFCCMGPCLVTQDELSYPLDLSIQSFVNGELRQNSRTSLLVFDIDTIIEELSQGMTLKGGTIIATGTPAGVGMGFVPPRFLKPQDVVVCRIEGLGELTNTVQ